VIQLWDVGSVLPKSIMGMSKPSFGEVDTDFTFFGETIPADAINMLSSPTKYRESRAY